jgi:hypothetical protein
MPSSPPPEPDRPVDVRAVYPDGYSAPVHCLYLGDDRGGRHWWQATVAVRGNSGPALLAVAAPLPPNTKIIADFG